MKINESNISLSQHSTAIQFLRTDQNHSKKIQKNSRNHRKHAQNEKSNFQELLQELLPPQKEPELYELWSQLPFAEKNLIENPSEENLEKYKEIVKAIAEHLIKKNMKINILKRRTKTGKEIILSYVKIIDTKLHTMMLAIQSKKNTAFEILKNLKEIKGLLLDLRQ